MKNTFFLMAILFFSVFANADPLPLAALMNDVEHDPTVQAASADVDVARGEHAMRESESGWQVYAGASVGRFRELVTDTLINDYYGRTYSVGVRYPLLGSLRRQLEAVQASESTTQYQKLQVALRRAERRLALRTAYADWWRAQQEQLWCAPLQTTVNRAFLQLRRRERDGLMLSSEANLARNGWKQLQTLCSDKAGAELDTRATLETLVQHPLPADATAVDDPLAQHPQPLTAWQVALEQQPRMAARRVRVTEAGKNRDQPWYEDIESNISIGYNIEDRSGVTTQGHGLVASLNFLMPLEVGSHSSARHQANVARYISAMKQLLAERRNLMVELGQSLRLQREARQELESRDEELAAAKLLLNDRRARSSLDEEGSYSQIQDAQRQIYQAGFARIAAWHRLWLQDASLRLLVDGDPQADVLLGAQRVRWLGQAAQGAAAADPVGTTVAAGPPRATASSWSQGVYVWDSAALLDSTRRTTELMALGGAGMRQIYLGLNAAQLGQLAQTKQSLAALLEEARTRNLRIGLLLGDSAWINPSDRGQLIALIGSLKELPFSSLHLDLEVEQLGVPVPDDHLQNWVDTVAAAVKASPWPVEISSHYRWFAAPKVGQTCVPCELSRMRVAGVSLMIYTRNPKRSTELAAQIARRWPSLSFRLAQSVESQLTPQESWAGVSPNQLDEQEQRWRAKLEPLGVTGIDWQDWHSYPRFTQSAQR